MQVSVKPRDYLYPIEIPIRRRVLVDTQHATHVGIPISATQ
jgi:hypothetical protein